MRPATEEGWKVSRTKHERAAGLSLSPFARANLSFAGVTGGNRPCDRPATSVVVSGTCQSRRVGTAEPDRMLYGVTGVHRHD